jgi:hypothetical protein
LLEEFEDRLDLLLMLDRTVLVPSVPIERAVVADFVVATDRAVVLAEVADLIDPTDLFDGETYFLVVLGAEEVEEDPNPRDGPLPPKDMGFFLLKLLGEDE